MSRLKVHARHPKYKRTLCYLSVEEGSTWPKGGAIIGLYDSDVTCKVCLEEMRIAKAPEVFLSLSELGDPREVSIGTRVLVRRRACVVRQRGFAELVPQSEVWREAWVVGWTARWTSWKIEGSRGWDGEEAIAIPKSTGVLLRVRYTPNGAEKLVFPQDARLLDAEGERA